MQTSSIILMEGLRLMIGNEIGIEGAMEIEIECSFVILYCMKYLQSEKESEKESIARKEKVWWNKKGSKIYI
jgi:hypothetical protein